MKTLIIKKNRKGLIRWPVLLKGDTFKARILVTESMLGIEDDCNPGWSKITGAAFLYHHWNSYRLVCRVYNNKMYFGYYCYINKVSPQDNKAFKSHLSILDTVIEAKTGEEVSFSIRFTDKAYIDIKNESRKDVSGSFMNQVYASLPLPKGWLWPMWETDPHLKCKAKTDIHYKLL